jgi:hypothetical protein
VIAPSSDAIFVLGTAGRQPLLLRLDRAPTLFQLTVGAEPGRIEVRTSSGDLLGELATPGSATVRHYQRILRRAGGPGAQVWVHGQVQRAGLDLIVVLHCPPG